MKTIYNLDEIVTGLKKWHDRGVKRICIDIDENRKTRITA